MQQNTHSADIAVMQAHIESLCFHAYRLHEVAFMAGLNEAGHDLSDPCLVGAIDLADTVLAAIGAPPALNVDRRMAENAASMAPIVASLLDKMSKGIKA